MDGNNSMKRLDGSGHADERVFSSDYHISPDEVDVFKDDVRKPPIPKPGSLAEEGASPCDGDETVCAEHWQAANGVSLESLTQVFEQCGAFISACRHGLVETLVEMRRSGEL
jgi:Kyakuja-Dileera-Zisupton transposase